MVKKIIAKPTSLRFSDKEGYRLIIKIVDGPEAMVDRIVSVQLTSEQLSKIVHFDSNTDIKRVELS